MQFSEALAEITRRLEGYDGNAFFVDFAYYSPEKKEWTIKIHLKGEDKGLEAADDARA